MGSNISKRNQSAQKLSFIIDLVHDELIAKRLYENESHYKKRIAYKKLIFLLRQERKSIK